MLNRTAAGGPPSQYGQSGWRLPIPTNSRTRNRRGSGVGGLSPYGSTSVLMEARCERLTS